MKKLLKVASLSTLSLMLVACSGTSSSSTSSTETKVGGQLIVDSNVIKGNFFQGFGNTYEDANVKMLLTGKASTVYTTGSGELKVNSTFVKEVTNELDANGDTVYTIKLNEGLKWSDGEALTAKDYVFSTLLKLSDEYAGVGASVATDGSVIGEDAYKAGVLYENYDAYVEATKDANETLQSAEEGSNEYNAALEVVKAAKEQLGEKEGENGYHKGLKLVDDLTFTVTISKDFIPYFYDLLYVTFEPAPLHVLASGAEIVSDDNGTTLTGVNLDDVAKAIIAEDGYLHKPTVVAGPYTLESFENNEVILKVNPNYAGDQDGNKPTIETIIIRGNTNPNLAGERLINGEVDIVAAQFQADIVEKLEEKGFPSTKYDRLGYGHMPMGFTDGPTKDVHVRRALAHIIDRQSLISSFLGAGNGIAVNAEVATAQWMYIENKEALSELNSYDFSIDEANKELDQSEYKFQADGTTPWVAGSGSRYNANKEELVIKHFGTENNPVTDLLKSNLTTNGEKVGIKYESTLGDWNALIDQYYYWSKHPSEDRYNIFNLATSFTAIFDPYLTNHSRLAGTSENPMEISDPVLDELSEKMRKLDRTQRDEYSKLWLEYQTRYNEILPFLPLYANVYRDYYNGDKVAELPTTSFNGWVYVVEQIKLK